MTYLQYSIIIVLILTVIFSLKQKKKGMAILSIVCIIVVLGFSALQEGFDEGYEVKKEEQKERNNWNE